MARRGPGVPEARRDRIILALDLPAAEAGPMIELLRPWISTFKIGPALFLEAGPPLLRRLKEEGKQVFLDFKFYDIPSVVARAVEAAAGWEVDFLTVHVMGGRQMLEAAVAAGRKGGQSSPRLLGVTVLTSEPGRMAERVLTMVQFARDAGLHGVVASGEEVAAIKTRYGERLLVVVPGIRSWGLLATDDQARRVTAAQAFSLGADYIVVGRPIWAAPDPLEAVRALIAEVEA